MRTTNRIITIYPNYRGMGYVVCENTKEIIKYGIGKFHCLVPVNYAKRMLKMINYYRPDVIVLKDYDKTKKVTSRRVKNVIDCLEKEAYKKNLQVYKYKRSDIAQVFSKFGQSNKYGISRTLASWYPDLERFLAPLRTLTMPEHYYMGVFDAFALMVTHYTLTGMINIENED